MIVPRLRAQRSAALLPFVEDYFAEVLDVRSINLAQGGGGSKIMRKDTAVLIIRIGFWGAGIL